MVAGSVDHVPQLCYGVTLQDSDRNLPKSKLSAQKTGQEGVVSASNCGRSFLCACFFTKCCPSVSQFLRRALFETGLLLLISCVDDMCLGAFKNRARSVISPQRATKKKRWSWNGRTEKL